MGTNARDKNLRHARRPRQSTTTTKLQQQQLLHHHLFHHPTDDSISTPDPSQISTTTSSSSMANPNPIDDAGWGYCTEEQLEELLLKNLELVYREALARLVSLGYDEDLAIRAILRSGHCYGSMDVLSNILHNALSHLNNNINNNKNSSSSGSSSSSAPEPAAFSDLRHLEEYSLAGMVCLLQQVRPHLSRGDAMWCLLMSDLHVGRASTIEVPPVGPTTGADFPCKFHGDGSVGIDPNCPNRFDHLPPSLKSLLKRNAARFRAAAKTAKTPQNLDAVNSVLSMLESLKIEEDLDEVEEVEVEEDEEEEVLVVEEKGVDGAKIKKKEIIMDLIRQVRELEAQVAERKEWAQQKALQAARKLSNDMMELKMLRMEREESLLMKKARQGMEDSTVKKLGEVEDAMREVSRQVDHVNVVVRGLEIENLEIKAEIEAAELGASESLSRCLEVEKREKKDLKRLSAWEKQKVKLQEDIAEERKKVVELKQQLKQVYKSQKVVDVKWRQEVKDKEQAIAQVEEEQKATEAADAGIRRKHEALRHKIEIDSQRQRDDLQRLEEELSRLKASAGSTKLNSQLSGDTDGTKAAKEVNSKTLLGFNKPEESSQEMNRDRGCIFCMRDKASVVFLPCAHQVLCVSCNVDHEKRVKTCPYCSFKIEQRIRVFGACA